MLPGSAAVTTGHSLWRRNSGAGHPGGVQPWRPCPKKKAEEHVLLSRMREQWSLLSDEWNVRRNRAAHKRKVERSSANPKRMKKRAHSRTANSSTDNHKGRDTRPHRDPPRTVAHVPGREPDCKSAGHIRLTGRTGKPAEPGPCKSRPALRGGR